MEKSTFVVVCENFRTNNG